MTAIGRLEEITDLRTIWPHEAVDFTPWLSLDENMALLADAVGLDITVEETESSVGDFHVDIYASETGTDRKIIIENQLEDTDHDHLGKLITYASGKSADVVIWIVKRAREEHKSAIEWLNNHTDDRIGFFLCEIKLYRIGDSAPAVKFEVIERPNGWAKELRKNDTVSPTQQLRFEYWAAFMDYAFGDPSFAKEFNRRSPNGDSWMNFSVGSSLCCISVSQIRRRGVAVVEFNIPDDKAFYKRLEEKKDAIETAAGISMDWQELPLKKACRICVEKAVDFDDRDAWKSQFDWIMDRMLRLKKGFQGHLKR